MTETRRSTQIPIYVCRSVNDTEIHREPTRSWYSRIVDALCGSVEKKWDANKSRMRVNEMPSSLVPPSEAAKVFQKSCVGKN